ncbi:RNA polymerase sigma-70 factor [Echinicola strongylocentroti]|uniref:RNA polymerase sigma-70 factor n=1 Tax=Echinicola strongylocentroti TaxID=1795355 RepID=A0A2Z4IQ55_9BACT|nr:RNA polymerase sigma-70 factor [Echinicola strongylocentroti]AWW32967.1 RNA polymerase sigma-70 factor [Echinicola strongylocentroti]
MFEPQQHIDSSKFIALLQKDGGKAFELLFKLYYDKLLHLAKYYTNNAEDAEEIVQDVFLKLWERRKKITELNNSYLFTMTKNACLDYLKHQSVVQKKSKELYDSQLADPLRFIQNETASYVLEKELDQKIQESIAALPTKQREVFIKSRMDGKKNMEIAQELKISKRTVDTHITLALKAMRLQLKEFLMVML